MFDKNEYARNYYRLHREEKCKKQKEWYRVNRDKDLERRRKYYLEKQRTSTREYVRGGNRKNNEQNFKNLQQRMKELYEKNKQLLLEYRKSLCCDHCGSKSNICFHHTDPDSKSFGITDHLNSLPFAAIMKELEKCIPLCRSCHQRHHNLSKNNPI